jgi:hypothetical protein
VLRLIEATEGHEHEEEESSCLRHYIYLYLRATLTLIACEQQKPCEMIWVVIGKQRKEMEYEREVDTTALQFYMRLLVERVLLQEY